MTAIIGEVEVTLSHDRSLEEYKYSLNNVLSETIKMNELINNLFEMAQANIEVNTEEIRLDELLWQVKDEWCNKIKGSQIDLDYELPADSKDITILGNRHLLFIALGNLINNAIKFSNNQNVVCRLYTEGQRIKISIKDKGIGIPESEWEKIFTPFTRGSNSGGYSGLGIGLSLTEKILKLHNAKIGINKNYKNGTEFIIDFEL
jgi:signal transduction histidine kinase